MSGLRRFARILTGMAVLVGVQAAQAAPLEVVVNGGFETGDFTGWTVTNLAGGSGNWFVDTVGSTTPSSGFSTSAVGAGGSFYAVSDQGGPGTHALTQTIVIPVDVTAAVFSFDMFVNNYNPGGSVVGPIFDHSAGANQHARVDLLTAGAGAFDTGAGVLANFYIGDDGPADDNPHDFTHYSFDILPFVTGGGTFQIRFAEVDNQLFFNQGVDNVSVLVDSAVPEPSSLALLAAGLIGIAGYRLRRRC